MYRVDLARRLPLAMPVDPHRGTGIASGAPSLGNCKASLEHRFAAEHDRARGGVGRRAALVRDQAVEDIADFEAVIDAGIGFLPSQDQPQVAIGSDVVRTVGPLDGVAVAAEFAGRVAPPVGQFALFQSTGELRLGENRL